MAVKRPKRELTVDQDFPVATGQATHPKCICWFGWVCEDHHDQPWAHDGCGGAGDPWPTKNCPYEDDLNAIFAIIHRQVPPVRSLTWQALKQSIEKAKPKQKAAPVQRKRKAASSDS